MKPTLRDRALGTREMWARARVAAGRARRRAGAEPLASSPETEGSKAARLPVNCIVFSKNRAMQLDACLRSIERLAPYKGPIVVVYLATTPRFADGYEMLDSGARVRLVEQGEDFQRDVMTALDPESEYTVFHTDDDVFFRGPPTAPVLPAGFSAFSLRLGANTTYCYPLRRSQPVPATSGNGLVIAWDWTHAKDDFAYPMSLDGHVFSTRLLLRMLSRARFTNPNQLEEELHLRRYLAPAGMLAFRESCVVSIPANVVSATHGNRASGRADSSAESLNERFLRGERIDLDSMDFSSVTAAHQEVPLAFEHSRLET